MKHFFTFVKASRTYWIDVNMICSMEAPTGSDGDREMQVSMADGRSHALDAKQSEELRQFILAVEGKI